ncbi:MAG: phosphate signaling complex protein PhoU [Methylocystis sp.]
MSDHIVKSYDKLLEGIVKKITEMGGLAEKILADSLISLNTLDVDFAQNVVSQDKRIDVLQKEIEEVAINTIARRQPISIDLRECISAMRIAADIERVGDLAKNIARRTMLISSENPASIAIIGLKTMQEVASSQLRMVIDAYVEKNTEKALEIIVSNSRLNALEDSVFRDLLTYMMEDPRNITFCTHLLFCSKNLERIGDHTKDIAITITYLVTGEMFIPEPALAIQHYNGIR